jgi:hypothetical protein
VILAKRSSSNAVVVNVAFFVVAITVAITVAIAITVAVGVRVAVCGAVTAPFVGCAPRFADLNVVAVLVAEVAKVWNSVVVAPCPHARSRRATIGVVLDAIGDACVLHRA